MRRSFTIMFVFLGIFFFSDALTAQVDFALNDWGRIRFWDPAGTRHVDRISINYAINDSTIFHYRQVGITLPFVLPNAITPAIADSERVAIICYFKDPDTIAYVTHHVYWWQNKNYIIVRYGIRNNGAAQHDSHVSFELIPQLEQAYGGEDIGFDADNATGYATKPNHFVGIKILSHPLFSLRAMDYSAAGSSYWLNMPFLWGEMSNAESTDFPLNSPTGALVFFNAGQHSIPVGDSTDVYIAIAYGSDLTALQTEISDAQNIYDTVITSLEAEETTVRTFKLFPNYPNPFNPQTTIRFELPQAGDIKLAVYNMQGRLIKTLSSGQHGSGTHLYTWDGTDMNGNTVASGIYIYQLSAPGVMQSQKMVFVK